MISGVSESAGPMTLLADRPPFFDFDSPGEVHSFDRTLVSAGLQWIHVLFTVTKRHEIFFLSQLNIAKYYLEIVR